MGKLQRIKQKSGASRVVIGIEPSGHYWKPSTAHLVSEGRFFELYIPRDQGINSHKAAVKAKIQQCKGVEEGLEAAGVRLKSILREFQFYKEELEKYTNRWRKHYK